MSTSVFCLEPEFGVASSTIIKGVSIIKIEYELIGGWVICPAEYLNIISTDQGTRITNVSSHYLTLRVSF